MRKSGFEGRMQVRELPFEAKLPDNTITRSEAIGAFSALRQQAADVPEMTHVTLCLRTNVGLMTACMRNLRRWRGTWHRKSMRPAEDQGRRMRPDDGKQ